MKQGEPIFILLYTGEILSAVHSKYPLMCQFEFKDHEKYVSMEVNIKSNHDPLRINGGLKAQDLSALHWYGFGSRVKHKNGNTAFGVDCLFFDSLENAKTVCKNILMPELLKRQLDKLEVSQKEFHEALTELERLEKMQNELQ